MPCSPVITPPQASTCRNNSSSAASTFFRTAVASVWIMRGHDIDMDIAVAGMAETGNRKAEFKPKLIGEFREVRQPAARDDDIFVEFGQSRGFERRGELAAQFPQPFTFDLFRRPIKGGVRQSASLEQKQRASEPRISRSRAGHRVQAGGGFSPEGRARLRNGRAPLAG